jgi:hypothetical protein
VEYTHNIKLFDDNTYDKSNIEAEVITTDPFPPSWVLFQSVMYIYDVTDPANGYSYYVEASGVNLDAV